MRADLISVSASALSRVAALVAVALVACGAPGRSAAKAELTVAAAVSLKEAFRELELEFEATHPEVDVVFNFAGSQVLAAQIAAGAPADVFAAADQAQIDRAARSGRLLPARVFAKNRLVLITPAGDPRVQTPADLARPGLRVVLAGESVPVGVYSRAALARVRALEATLANVVSTESDVRGVLGKVAASEADAGIIYATDVTEAVADRVRVVPFPGAGEVVPAYAIAALNDSPRPALAAAFVDAVLGPAGAAALARHGFLPR